MQRNQRDEVNANGLQYWQEWVLAIWPWIVDNILERGQRGAMPKYTHFQRMRAAKTPPIRMDDRLRFIHRAICALNESDCWQLILAENDVGLVFQLQRPVKTSHDRTVRRQHVHGLELLDELLQDAHPMFTDPDKRRSEMEIGPVAPSDRLLGWQIMSSISFARQYQARLPRSDTRGDATFETVALMQRNELEIFPPHVRDQVRVLMDCKWFRMFLPVLVGAWIAESHFTRSELTEMERAAVHAKVSTATGKKLEQLGRIFSGKAPAHWKR